MNEINIVRYGSQFMILAVGTCLTLLSGFLIFPFWSLIGPLAIIFVFIGIGFGYLTVWLMDLIDDWADPLIG